MNDTIDMPPGTPPHQRAEDKQFVLESPKGVRSFPHHYHEEKELSHEEEEKIYNYRGWLEAGVPFETVFEWMKQSNDVNRTILEEVVDGNVDFFFSEKDSVVPMLPPYHDVLSHRATEMARNSCLEVAASTYRRMLLSGVKHENVLQQMQQDGIAGDQELVDAVCNLLGE